MLTHKESLTKKEQNDLLSQLKIRFEKNTKRHPNLHWTAIEKKLKVAPQKMWSLLEMEKTDGEPDVIGYDPQTFEYIFCDCSKESPSKRRSLCYDLEAFLSRKKNKPRTSALEMAAFMKISILTESQYRDLQKIEAFDTKTSSWIMTPIEIRKLNGALFCDRRYQHVFLYHNGPESYYASRGFRGILKV